MTRDEAVEIIQQSLSAYASDLIGGEDWAKERDDLETAWQVLLPDLNTPAMDHSKGDRPMRLHERTFTYDDVFTAMCITEEFESAQQGTYPGYDTYRDNNGICETRDRIIEMVPHANAVWKAATKHGYETPFDFEFIPDFLKLLTNATDEDMGQRDGLGFVMKEDQYEALGHYIALLGRANDRASLVMQSLRGLREGKSYVWSPETIERDFK